MDTGHLNVKESEVGRPSPKLWHCLKTVDETPSETSFRDGPPNTVVLNFLRLAFSQKIKIVFRLENKQRSEM